MKSIYERLKEYSASDYYAFHMPGHKRNMSLPGEVPASRIDITEIEGFDDLHHAKGMLKSAQERAARLYGSDRSYFLVNGSTVGILSSILGVSKRGEQILVARNCHKSVYHAIYMNELHPVYLYPGFDAVTQLNTAIDVTDVRSKLEEHPDIRAVVIVSPTYDGVVSDVEAIAKVVHAKGIPLIVDEAHGAHLGFHPYFPDNSNRKGADLVIHSVHKTLPSLTQTALLHVNGTLVDANRVERYLSMLQSSSPSYVLMASIDNCMDLLENHREELFLPYVNRLSRAREKLSGLKRIRFIREPGAEPSKIILSGKDAGMTGKELYERLLSQYHLQMEMYAGTYVLAMTSPGDTDEGMERLVQAVTEIDRELLAQTDAGTDRELLTQPDTQREESADAKEGNLPAQLPRLPQHYTSGELERETKNLQEIFRASWQESIGCISLEYAYLYPPGIPIVVPGEQITEAAANMLEAYEKAGYSIEGRKGQDGIEVWKHGKDILYNG